MEVTAKTEICSKALSCGHRCGGVAGESTCLPCLHCPGVRQSAHDLCVICYTEQLDAAPAIQLACGHVFHRECCAAQIEKRWPGPRITFRFLMCPVCEDRFMEHPLMEPVAKPMMGLYEEVRRKALTRLEYQNETKNKEVTSSASKFFNKPALYAMERYAYYVCIKCSKAYYGGEARCVIEAGVSMEYDPKELVCGVCSNAEGAVQVCPKHGTDFLEYKCRYCCSIAIYFCFGTTRFCSPCHSDHSRLGSLQRSGGLPSCPVGPTAVKLDATECPLRIAHPPTGEEFSLGCGVCHNAHTF